MQTSRSSLLAILKNAVTDEELRDSVVYIIPNLAAGEEIVINRKKTKVNAPSQLLFIDLEPKANWSHRCRYIMIDNDGKIQATTEGQFPPEAERLQLLVKPDNIEDWVLMTDKFYDT